MIIEVVGRDPSGTCDLTNKSDTETWAIRTGADAEVQHVCTQRLPEVLRVLTRAGTDAPRRSGASQRSPSPAAGSNSPP